MMTPPLTAAVAAGPKPPRRAAPRRRVIRCRLSEAEAILPVWARGKTEWTDDEIMSLPKVGYKYEIIDGELKMCACGFEHEDIGMNIAFALRLYLQGKDLGRVCGSSFGTNMLEQNPTPKRTLLSPDVSFVSRARIPTDAEERRRYLAGAPDFVVEILSPKDTFRATEAKLPRYFANGARLAWLVVPRQQQVYVYTSPRRNTLRTLTDTLDGRPVFEDFTMPVRAVFAAA